MALIRCYECGKEISSLATACPSCGAPPEATIAPPPLPTETRPASRAKRLFGGTLAVLTGVVLVLVIRGVTYQPNSPSVATAPTPAAGKANTTSSLPVEAAAQGSPTLATAQTPSTEAPTTSSPPVEAASQTSSTLTTAETPAAQANTTSSPALETGLQSSPSQIVAETPNASDVSTVTAPPPQATYQVTGISQGDYLNVRDGAGSDYQVVTRLEPGTSGILLGAKRVANGATTWQEITVNGQTGWVNAAYIALETQTPVSPPTEASVAP